MPAIDGIVSGIDTTGLINSVIEAAAQPQVAMLAQQEDLEERREKIAALASRLSDVSSAIDDIDEADDWNISTKVTGDNVAFTATVDDDAALGTYNILVDTLAAAQVTASNGFADRATPGTIAHGVIDVTVGGELTPITIDGDNDTLADLAVELDAIEGITAYTVDTGDASNPWKLVVQADATGSDGAFTIDTSGLTSDGTSIVPTLTNVVDPDDAVVFINGVEITSSDNTLRDVVPGITLDLEATGATELLRVGEDRDALVDKVQAFVDAYNESLDFYATQSFFNAETGARGPLAGDGTARRAMSRVGFIVSGSYTVADAPDLEGLAQLGFSTQRDGKLNFDRSEFEDALEADYDAVKAFFTDSGGPMAALRTEIDDVQVDSEEGALTSRQESLKDSVESYDERIADFQEYLDSYAQRLRDQFTAMEVTLGRLQSSQSSLAALFAGLTSSSSS